MSNFISQGISQDTLRASDNSPEVLKAVQRGEWGEYLKNASLNSSNREKPDWLTTFENTTGDSLNISNNEEEKYKQANINSNNSTIPDWLVTFRNWTL